MRTLLLTADARRHRYATAVLAAGTELVGVVSERKAPAVPGEDDLPEADRDVLRRHLSARDDAEARLLGDPHPVEVDTLRVARGDVSSMTVAGWIAARRPEVVVLFGTGVIRDPLLGAWQGRMVNLHLGLSPYYRGSATNFWPLVMCQPECVGATIHLAAPDVDAGDILGQVRPDVSPEDGAHEMGSKTIIAALHQLPRLLERLHAGSVEPSRQNLAVGQVFRRRDFNADAVRRLWQNVERGMIADYSRQVAERCARYPIVEASA